MAGSLSEQRASGLNSARRAASRARAQSLRDDDGVAGDPDPPQNDGANVNADEAPDGAVGERSGPGAEGHAPRSRAVAVTPRFRIFVIDSGWNSVAGKVLRDNLALFNDLTSDHPTYLVDRATSVRLLRRHQEFVGCDPIISVHDLKAFERRRRGDVYGVRAHLGLLRDEKAVISLMQLLAGFLSRYRDSKKFEDGVRSELRLEGLQGAIEIVMGAVEHKELIA
jgi:hypothetical protein